MSRVRRPLFDKAGPFVARRSFRFAGTLYNPGDAFDVSDMTTRSSRRLYDARRIEYDETGESKKLDWRKMSEKALLKYAFEVTGTRFRKVERARTVLEAI